MSEKSNILVFDVESTNLHGKAFAVGAIVIDANGKQIDSLSLKSKESEKDAGDWVKQNVIPFIKHLQTVETDRELRDKFWEFYLKHKKDSYIWADVAYPVETNFLEQVFNDNPYGREFEMPYPLHDVANHIHTNIDRAEFSELSGVIKHDPYWDAKSSAFCLLKVRASLGDGSWEKIKKYSGEAFI